MERILYGKTADDREVDEFILQNKNGLEVRCISYGCRITRVLVPAGEGKADVVLGFDSMDGYEADDSSQGAFVGRYAGRIRNAEFELGEKTYHLTKNAGNDYLHGSFARQVFDAEVIGDNSISFTCTSPDGEDGFPAEVWVGVTYTLTDENELILDYQAVPTDATVLNFTNHAYFNLAGGGSVEDHLLSLNCDSFLEADETLLPTGRLADALGGVFDFTAEKPIGRDISADDPQLKLAGGYDHCFVINRQSPGMALAATLRDEASGRSLQVRTTQPGVGVYTANGLDGRMAGHGGAPMERHGAICLETQHYADAPHHPHFPSTELQPGERFHHITLFQFGWEGDGL